MGVRLLCALWLLFLGAPTTAGERSEATSALIADTQFASNHRWPRTLAFSAYNLGSTGYNQAVAIGKMLKDRYGVSLRVVPGKNDVSRLKPLLKGRVQYSANGMATYFAQEGVFQFAARSWGPLPVRLVMSSNGDSNQALAVAADTGIRSFAELKGKRVPWVRGAPALNVSTGAFLACGGLSWDDVERVDFPGYSAMWNGIVNGQVDAAYATTVSGPTRKLEASPRGIFWPPAPHADAACWSRIHAIAPYFVKHIGTRGARISKQAPHEGATYPYPMLMTLPNTPAESVTALVSALHSHYEDYRNADPGAVGWAMERQDLTWVVPYHRGAIAYFKAIGLWTDAIDAHNKRLLERQAVLATAWQAQLADSTASATTTELEWRQSWHLRRAAALEASGFDAVWR